MSHYDVIHDDMPIIYIVSHVHMNIRKVVKQCRWQTTQQHLRQPTFPFSRKTGASSGGIQTHNFSLSHNLTVCTYSVYLLGHFTISGHYDYQDTIIIRTPQSSGHFTIIIRTLQSSGQLYTAGHLQLILVQSWLGQDSCVKNL